MGDLNVNLFRLDAPDDALSKLLEYIQDRFLDW